MTAARREQLLSYAVLGVFSVLAIYPILSIVLLALHERSDLVTGFSIPDSLDFGSFGDAWTAPDACASSSRSRCPACAGSSPSR